MSDLETSGIQRLLDNERSNEERLESEIRDKQEELLRCQGKILAFEELLKNSASVFGAGYTVGSHGFGDNRPSDLKAIKERAPRTTKKEMERRRQMVGLTFHRHGDLSAKELQPLVEELLGYEMEPHHLRAVLRKFTQDFIKKDDHGIWGLTTNPVDQIGSWEEEDFDSVEEDPSIE
jgi:hypothetical protein